MFFLYNLSDVFKAEKKEYNLVNEWYAKKKNLIVVTWMDRREGRGFRQNHDRGLSEFAKTMEAGP